MLTYAVGSCFNRLTEICRGCVFCIAFVLSDVCWYNANHTTISSVQSFDSLSIVLFTSIIINQSNKQSINNQTIK